ncbi:MAG: class I SAM-dependent RNA methyltransferase [Clostridia bacterium]|nr:class I SAM-dependent RNA methyltransferase [Clostridia bacterium]
MEKIEWVDIVDYGYDGEGVGRLNGKVVFVPYALKGERVQISVKEDKSSFSNGQLLEIDKHSDLRQEAPCPYFGVCGGCAYQHTNYQNELRIKKNLLQKQLTKVGYGGQINVVESDKEYAYRNKIRLFVGEKGLALKERKSSKLCFVDQCLLVDDQINGAIEKINTFILAGNHQKDYSEVVIRKESDCLLVNFYKKTKTDINYQGLYLMLGTNFGIFETFKDSTVHKVGKKYLESEEFGLTCRFSPLSFHQVNENIGKKLYKQVIENIQGKNVLNCYSGAGVLSGIITKQGKRVVGVEIGEAEHQDAQFLKDSNNLFYLTNMLGDCSVVLPRLEEKFDTLVIDPPRGGISEKVVAAINAISVKRLIYVSCNSATLVRDLGRLKGFKIRSVTMFDMFSRTGEYETLVVLDKK